MRYVIDCSLDAFEAWSGGKTVLGELMDHPTAYCYVADMLDELTATSEWTDTDVNDFIWFDALDLLEEAGYYDSDSGLYSDEEEEEEEEEHEEVK